MCPRHGVVSVVCGNPNCWCRIPLADEYRAALTKCAERYEQMVPEDNPDLRRFVGEFAERIADYPLLKLNRWLGYIQGVLIAGGWTTVEAERDWTRPLFRPLDFA